MSPFIFQLGHTGTAVGEHLVYLVEGAGERGLVRLTHQVMAEYELTPGEGAGAPVRLTTTIPAHSTHSFVKMLKLLRIFLGH